jgi:signal transduction histidine kinase/ActR/RegA family two-component response regulator
VITDAGPVLILAPVGRDAPLAASLLQGAGLQTRVCADVACLCREAAGPVACLLIAQEALVAPAAEPLSGLLADQPAWSDLPIVLMTTEGWADAASSQARQLLGDRANVTLIERPFQAVTLLSVVRGALRARRRQYDVRDALAAEQQARRQAEAASQAKDNFLAMLSHELRTPLTPVLATTSLLLNGPARLPAGLREDLELIQRNVELEARLIDDLLDLTRVARGKLQLTLQTIDAHAAISAVCTICATDTIDRRQHVDLRLEAVAFHLLADAARFQQMCWNLLKNASKFTPEGGRITVRTANAPAGDRLRIEVVDTGKGIDPEQLPRLFTAFEQGDRSVNRQFGGLGLGLAITKALAELHGGRVQAHSAGPGTGATFTLDLPTVPAPAARIAPEAPVARPVRPMRILLVEDHLDTAHVMRRLLTSHGHQVTAAHSVAAAQAVAAGGRFDLVLSDVGLPDGTGIDFLSWFRKSSDAPAIALTGFGMEEDVQRCLAAGFTAHLTKPVSVQTLQEIVASVAREMDAPAPAAWGDRSP